MSWAKEDERRNKAFTTWTYLILIAASLEASGDTSTLLKTTSSEASKTYRFRSEALTNSSLSSSAPLSNYEKKEKRVETGMVLWNSVEGGQLELSLQNEKGQIFPLYADESVGREIKLYVERKIRVVDHSYSGKGLNVDAWMLMNEKLAPSHQEQANQLYQQAELEIKKAWKEQLKHYQHEQKFQCWGTCTFQIAGIWDYKRLRVTGYSTKQDAESAIGNECSFKCNRSWTTGCRLESVSCR